MEGRVGDTPVIGAGTFARNSTCAVSGTGIGEKFMKNCATHLISCLMEYKGLSLDEACNHVVHQVLEKGDGGVVAVGNDYSISMPFNSAGMYRACSNHKGRYEVKIWT
jgi:beta-aspartyl-peptidase (threonine type)